MNGRRHWRFLLPALVFERCIRDRRSCAKRFITFADADDLYDLVLARPDGARPGTNGLSVFYAKVSV
jgi:hypothetical protein